MVTALIAVFDLFRSTALAIQRRFDGYDPSALRIYDTLESPRDDPVFIVGPPRSGTTILHQLLARNCEVAYISNAMAVAPAHLVKIARTMKRLGMYQPNSIRRGEYGYVSGLRGPNEAGLLSGTWFRGDILEDEKRSIRATFAALSMLQRGPVLIKNLPNSLRIAAIVDVFPGARFLRLKRDPCYTAQSIVVGRRALFDDDTTWWSTQPEGYEAVLDRPAVYQAVWQVVEIEKAITRQLTDTGRKAVEVSYETFSESPDSEFSTICNALNLATRAHPVKPSDYVQPSRSQRLSDDEWSSLRSIHEELTGESA